MVNIYLTVGKLQQIEAQVQNYNTLFWICIIGMILFSAVTIFLFFYFHILSVFMELTGIRKRQEIGKLHKKNSHAAIQRKNAGKKPSRQNGIENVAAEVTEDMNATVVLQENNYMDMGETTVLDAPTDFIIEKELSYRGTEESL